MDNNAINFHDLFPPDPNKETITEEMHLEKDWFKEAIKIDEKGLLDFFTRIVHGYNHDYGTMCHAVAACALAAAWASCKEIGLSSFQAGFVMWDFIKNWTYTTNECGLKIIDYDNMLYPQYSDKFDKNIDKDTWKAIQEKAKANLDKENFACGSVIHHWKSIVEGYVPFGYRVVDRE